MKRFSITPLILLSIILLSLMAIAHTAWAEDKADLAKAAQNPVADMISLPLQNNTNFGVGPGDDVQNVLNIQPVIPVKLSTNWNMITRTIAPVIYQPELVPGTGSEFGLGDINTTLFLSPARREKSFGVQDRFFPSPRRATGCWERANGGQAPRWWY